MIINNFDKESNGMGKKMICKGTGETYVVNVRFQEYLITQLELSLRISKVASTNVWINLDRIRLILKALDGVNAYAEAETMNQINRIITQTDRHNRQVFEIKWDKRVEVLTHKAYCVLDRLFKNIEGKYEACIIV